VTVDTFDCEWQPGYQKYHHPYFVIVRPADGEDESYVCEDAFMGVRNIRIARDFLEATATFAYVLEADRSKQLDLSTDPVWAARMGIRTFQDSDTPRHLRRFAEFLAQDAPNFASEVIGPDEKWWTSPIFTKLAKVSQSRTGMADVLERVDQPAFAMIISELRRAANNWSAMRLAVLRGCDPELRFDAARKIADLLLRTIDIEELACGTLAGLVNEGEGRATGTGRPLPIQGFMDEKNFCSILRPPMDRGELACFAFDEIASAEWGSRLSGVRFDFSRVATAAADSIACRGQTLRFAEQSVFTDLEIATVGVARNLLPPSFVLHAASLGEGVPPANAPFAAPPEAAHETFQLKTISPSSQQGALGPEFRSVTVSTLHCPAGRFVSGISLPLSEGVKVLAVTAC
jgi:hypothetical protein